jgi:dethiobiotin synthetase
MTKKTFMVTAIDTDAGKTIVTGHIARYLKSTGLKVITQKIAQTGCKGLSDDICKHRQIMGEALNGFDRDGTTCPYVFEVPASPHLAAQLANTTIDLAHIKQATATLQSEYDVVVLEGVGGLMVPLTPEVTLIDYIADNQLPVVLVATSKLGSINHTLLSLEALKNRNIELIALIYNRCFDSNKLIANDSALVFRRYLKDNFPAASFLEVPLLENNEKIEFPDIAKYLQN